MENGEWRILNAEGVVGYATFDIFWRMNGINPFWILAKQLLFYDYFVFRTAGSPPLTPQFPPLTPFFPPLTGICLAEK